MENKTNYTSLFKLFLRSIFISFIGAIFPFIYILFPSMFVVESVDKGIFKSIGILALVMLSVGFSMGSIYAISIFTIFAPLILMFDYMIKSKKSVSSTIFVTSLTFFISVMVLFYAFGINAEVLNSQETYKNITNFYSEIAKRANVATSDIASLEHDFQIMYRTFLQNLPSIIIIVSLIVSYITYTSVGRTLIMRGKFIIQPSSLEFLRVPKTIVLLSVLTLAVVYLLGDYIGDWSRVFNINLINITGFFLFVTGIGVLKFAMTRFGVNRFLQGFIIILAIAVSYVQIFIAVIGACDYVFNFRKLRN